MRGLYAARRLVRDRHKRRFKKKDLRRKVFGEYYKNMPIAKAPQARGIVTEKIGVEAKQPNSAIRKSVRIMLIAKQKKVSAFVPRDGNLEQININDTVHIEGFGKKGRSKGDIPGVRFKVIKVQNSSLDAIYRHKKEKPAR